MKVAVLGAAGTVARAIVRDLAESEECSSLLLLDRDGPGAEAVAADHGAGKASAAGLDASDGLAEALDGCRVLVNAAGHRINLEAMEAALTAGCHYVDLGGLYWMTARQIELDERFIEAELLAVIGMGASPGQTNVMAERVSTPRPPPPSPRQTRRSPPMSSPAARPDARRSSPPSPGRSRPGGWAAGSSRSRPRRRPSSG
ncbi:MAG: saccharopine dehydrogenase NADP-binding domain-containing protein [Actinobacteria bacterium]|nr:saccharopine dehydrogenase NADP-binding domain-containing protein [Actinomycetota bacterium]